MRVASVLSVLLGALMLAHADERGDALTLPSLIATARAESPEIRAAEARYRAMAERPAQEGTLPDPSVGVAWHNERFDRITLGESEFAFVEFSAEQEVPFPGKLGLRARIAGREAERERAMRDATVLMILARAATRYFDLAVAERSAAILRESAATLDLMIEQAETSYGLGAAAQQDVLRARLERGGLDERLTMLEQRRVAAAAGINALLARPAAHEVPPTAGLGKPARPEPLAELLERVVAQAPELRAAREDVLRSEAALALAQREYLPDFALMGSYMNKSRLFPEWEVGMRVRVPLYFWRRQAPAVAEATHVRAAAEHGAVTRRRAWRAASAIPRERVVTVIDATHADLFRDQLARRAARTVVVQPANRETGPGTLLPLAHVLRADPEARVAILPSDHFVEEEERFMRHVDVADWLVRRELGDVAILGVEAERPDSDYGWIEVHRSGRHRASCALPVVRFWEKPPLPVACRLHEEGHLWSTMVTVARGASLWDFFRAVQPDVHRSFERVRQALGTADEAAVLHDAYHRMPSVSLSKGVFERLPSRLAAVAVRGVHWSDWRREERVVETLDRLRGAVGRPRSMHVLEGSVTNPR